MMRLYVLSVAFLLVVISAYGQDRLESTGTFGEPIDKKGAVSAKKLAQKMDKAESLDIKVKGTITEVCQDEITEVLMHPRNVRMPIFYKRVFKDGDGEKTWYYPDWLARATGIIDKPFDNTKTTIAEKLKIPRANRADLMATDADTVGARDFPGTVTVMQFIPWNRKAKDECGEINPRLGKRERSVIRSSTNPREKYDSSPISSAESGESRMARRRIGVAKESMTLGIASRLVIAP